MALEIYTLGKSHRKHGGYPSYIGTWLSTLHPSFGEAISEIYLTVAYNGRMTDHRGIPAIDLSNTVRFERKRGRYNITWVSSRCTPDSRFGIRADSITVRQWEDGFADVHDALSWGLAQRLKPQDDFGVSAFLDWVNAHRARKFESDEALRTHISKVHESQKKQIAAQAAADPWRVVDIDWDDMHPDARAILDDPKDWSNSDDFAPHGNDTGADIFARWSDYKALTAEQAAAEIGWGPEFDLNNALCWKDWVEINLALPFGHIKKTGTCPARLAQHALDVLRDDLHRAKRGKAGPLPEDYTERLTRYCDLLERFT